MSRPRSLKPAYCVDKVTGRAFVRIARYKTYLGVPGSQESLDRYDRVIGEWIARGRMPSVPARDVPSQPSVTNDRAARPAVPSNGSSVAMIIGAFWNYPAERCTGRSASRIGLNWRANFSAA